MPERFRSAKLGLWVLSGLTPLLVLLGFLWWLVGSSIHDLATGEDATVVTVFGCAEGSPMSGQTPYCSSSIRFADGHLERDRILGEPVSAGDTIFTGDGFTYTSPSPLYWKLTLNGILAVGMPVTGVVVWVLHRRDTARKRRAG